VDRRPNRWGKTAAFSERLPSPRVLPLLLIPLVALVAVSVVRMNLTPARLAIAMNAGVTALDPAELTATAAALLEGSTRPGGPGYRFEIVQTSTMVAKPGGPQIPIPNATGRGTKELADRYYLHTLLERGVVRPDGFFSEMMAGPQEESAKPDWEGALVMYQALVRDGTRWRNDGDGWYGAESLPGIGLDPDTAALLPTLLRSAEQPADAKPGDPKIDPDAARNLAAGAVKSDIPGLVAADGVAFTELQGKFGYGFDDSGRLVSINTTALNTNMTDFDLVIDTTIEIFYDAVGELPEPKPVAEGMS
jgi:hypothetical protein